MSTYDADLTKADNMILPPDWKLENGYLILDECRDEWALYGDKLVRRHYLQRNKLFDPTSNELSLAEPLPQQGQTNTGHRKHQQVRPLETKER